MRRRPDRMDGGGRPGPAGSGEADVRFAIDPDGGTPVYLQLEDQVRYGVAVGELRPGDRLPSIRELEAKLGINRNTVRRAYLDLEREGTLLVRHGRVPVVAPPPARLPRRPPASAAADLARKVLRDVESRGIDAVAFAGLLGRVAAEHDERYPRCAVVECSRSQAEDYARAVSAAWRRRVVGVDLERLREEPRAMPASVRHVLTTRWHLAEARSLLAGHPLSMREITVRMTRETVDAIRGFAGRETGLIIRDAESRPGYARLVAKLVKSRGPVRTALIGEVEAAREILRSVEAVVYTPPCREFVRGRAPARLAVRELGYEPVPDCLDRLAKEMFPDGAPGRVDGRKFAVTERRRPA